MLRLRRTLLDPQLKKKKRKKKRKKEDTELQRHLLLICLHIIKVFYRCNLPSHTPQEIVKHFTRSLQVWLIDFFQVQGVTNSVKKHHLPLANIYNVIAVIGLHLSNSEEHPSFPLTYFLIVKLNITTSAFVKRPLFPFLRQVSALRHLRQLDSPIASCWSKTFHHLLCSSSSSFSSYSSSSSSSSSSSYFEWNDFFLIAQRSVICDGNWDEYVILTQEHCDKSSPSSLPVKTLLTSPSPSFSLSLSLSLLYIWLNVINWHLLCLE